LRFRTQFWLLLILVGLLMQVVAAENISKTNDGVVLAVNLKAAGEQARQKKIPLMIFFAAEECEFCERLEADYLSAMANSDAYRQRVLIRKVVIDSYDDFLDFSGKDIEADVFSDKYNIQVTPTLVFVDHKGVSIARRIIGYNASGFFGAELDELIDAASAGLR